MALSAVEAAAQRRVTKAFVDADADQITLSAPVRVANGAGGYRTERANRASQPLRLQPTATGTERVASDGRVVTSTHVLVGYYGSEMERFDTFTKDDQDYEIVWVYENREYETKAEVISVG